MPFNPCKPALALTFLQLMAACSPQTPPQEPASSPPPVVATPLGSGAGGTDGGGHNAAAAGASGAPTGTNATEKMCGGIAGVKCAAKEYCAYAPEAHCGAADMSGTCAPVPDACIEMLDEVCGCDDKTYGNPCKAAQAGVSVVMKGACTKKPEATIAEGKLCGTRGVAGECAAGLYCQYQPDCGRADAGGKCAKKPTMCTKIYSPVCGCDDKTYGSACTAAAEGISVASKGACKP
jgi:hypothetical protein